MCLLTKSDQDGVLTFDEAIVQTNGTKLTGPLDKPLQTTREPGPVQFDDLPLRIVEKDGGMLEQFCGIILDHPWDGYTDHFERVIYKNVVDGKYKDLPKQFSLTSEVSMPTLMQIIMVPVNPPEDAPNPEQTYVNITKHIYLNKNKLPSSIWIDLCRGLCHRFEWGGQNRAGLLALNYMLNHMGGLQIRFWSIQPKLINKKTPDNVAREEGCRFIREKGPKTNNRNQFMAWTDQHIQAHPSKAGRKERSSRL